MCILNNFIDFMEVIVCLICTWMWLVFLLQSVSLNGTIKLSLSLLCIFMIWENMDLEIWSDIILMNHSLHHSDVPEYIFNENVQQQRYSSYIKMFHFKQLQCLYFLHALKSVLTLSTKSENRIKNFIFPLSV